MAPLANCLRVTVGTPEENDAFLSALAEVWHDPPGQRGRQRATKETTIEVSLTLDGTGWSVSTGLPFFDHMVAQLGQARRLRPDRARRRGPGRRRPPHRRGRGHPARRGLAEALGDKAGVRRFASIDVPLDEALIEVALDLSGRPFLAYEVDPGAGGRPTRSARRPSTRSWPRSSGGPSSPRPGSPCTCG
jgi:hypothetical protein